MKKKLTASLLVLVLVLALLPAAAMAAGFTDVPADAFFAKPVEWAVSKGVTDGTSDTTFSPNDTCTRGQVVTFLWRAANQPEPTEKKSSFSDVTADAYFGKAVLWAVEKGITDGTSDTTFSPDDGCTRGQVVTFLHRAEGKPAAQSGKSFSDVAADAYYADAVKWAVSKEITDGTSDTTFSPNDTCTRSQIVTFLYRDAQSEPVYVPVSCTQTTTTDFQGNKLDEPEMLHVTWEYDAHGNNTKVTHKEYGVTQTQTFNELGDVLTYFYQEGTYTTTRTYSYNDDGKLVKTEQVNEDGSDRVVEEFHYDANGVLTGSTMTPIYDGETGTPQESKYDASGRLSEVTENLRNIHEYNPETGEYTTKDNYVTYKYTYDSHGNLVKMATESGPIFEYLRTYDANGNQTKYVLRMGGQEEASTYTFTYDEHGNVRTETRTDPSGFTYTVVFEYKAIPGSSLSAHWQQPLVWDLPS